MAVAEIAVQVEESPGSQGMMSAIDATQLPAGAAQILKNVDPWSVPGALRKRTKINKWGKDSIGVYSGASYWDPITGAKGLVAIIEDTSVGTGKFSYTGDDADSIRAGTVLSGMFPYHTNTYDWVYGDGFIVFSDGRNVPMLFTTRKQVEYNSSSDSLAEAGRVLDVGLAPPGAPIVSVIPCDGDSCLTGTYQYAFDYSSAIAYDTCDPGYSSLAGGLGYPSRTVELSGEKAIVTGVEFYPHTCCSTTTVKVWRRDVYENGNAGDWEFRVTSPEFERDSNATGDDWHGWYHVDSAQGDSAGSMTDTAYAECDHFTAFPGQVHVNDSGAANEYKDVGTDTSSSFDWVVRYSYYDPALGLESPLGPPLEWYAEDSINDNLDAYFPLPDTTCRPTHIRVYRSLYDTLLTGGGNDNVLYGIAQFRPDRQEYDLSFCTDTVMTDDPTDTSTYDWNDFQYFTTSAGGPVILGVTTDLFYDNEYPFSDLEYVDGRFWGISADYPGRLWYSNADEIDNWDLTDYVSLEEHVNDELVAIEPISGQFKDYLYALKHGSIWMVSGAVAGYGYDVTGSADYPVVKRPEATGAIHKNTVLTFGGKTYFIAPSLDIYSLSPVGLQRISDPVRDWCDTLFGDHGRVIDSVVCFVMQDAVKFHDRGRREMLSWNTVHEAWTLEDYWISRTTKLNPKGAFRYDTSHAFGWYADKMYFDDAYHLYARDQDERASRYSPWRIKFPMVGDGRSQWRANEMQITFETTDTTRLHYAVYNDEDRFLFGDSVDIGAAAVTDLRYGLAGVFGKYLCIDLQSHVNDRKGSKYLYNDILLRNMQFRAERMGLMELSESRTDSTLEDPPDGDSTSTPVLD
jgi:hypothetical protein